MLDKISKNKNVLNYCVSLAQKTAKSKSVTDVFKTLIKIANVDTVFDSLQAQIDEIIQRTNGNTEALISFLNDNTFTLADTINELPGNEIGKSNAYSFMLGIDDPDDKKNWLEYTANALIKGQKLRSTITNIISQGVAIEKIRELKKKQKGVQSLQSGEQFGYEAIAKPDQYNLDNTQREISSEEEVQKLDLIFKEIIEDPHQDILSIYVENTLYPMFEELKGELREANSPQETVLVEERLRDFYNYAVNYIKVQFSTNKRDPIKKTTEPNSLLDVQNKVNEVMDNLEIDELVENIIQSSFYSLPKGLKKYINDDPNFVKQVIKSIIKTSLILNTKEELQVSLPDMAHRRQSGKHGLSAGDLMHHIIIKQLKSFYTDPNEQNNVIHKALNMLNAKKDETGKWKYGSGRNFIDYSFLQHATPFVYSGIINRFVNEFGDQFGSLSEDQKNQVVDFIYNKVHPYMPHTEFKDKYFHNIKKPSDIGEENIKAHIRQRLEVAEAIHKGEVGHGTLLHPHDFNAKSGIVGLEDDLHGIEKTFSGDFNIDDSFRDDDDDDLFGIENSFKQSELNSMIKKYALKNNITGR